MRVLFALPVLLLAACSGGQNLIQAQDARRQLVGMGEDKILACMGRPQGRFTFSGTEVWQYNSNVARDPAKGTSNTYGTAAMAAGAPVGEARYCVVNIAMGNKTVQSVNYSGISGATPEDELCAAALKGCLPQ
jgi:hypothetical protein